MFFLLYFTNFLLLLLLDLLEPIVEDVGGSFRLVLGVRVDVLRLSKLVLEVLLELSDFLSLSRLELLHLLFVQKFDVYEFLLQLEVLFNFETDLLLEGSLDSLRLAEVSVVE